MAAQVCLEDKWDYLREVCHGRDLRPCACQVSDLLNYDMMDLLDLGCLLHSVRAFGNGSKHRRDLHSIAWLERERVAKWHLNRRLGI